MEFLTDLWIPILVAAVFVFLVSSVIHMVIPIHKGDYQPLPDEDGLMAAMREKGLAPGSYGFPCPRSMKEMTSPEMVEKYKEGPVGFMTVLPTGLPQIGKSLIQWFLFSILVGLFVAYVASLSLDAGAGFRPVFRLCSTLGTMAYALGYFNDSIWKGVSWKITLKYLFDGLLYGLATGAAFGWLWPS